VTRGSIEHPGSAPDDAEVEPLKAGAGDDTRTARLRATEKVRRHFANLHQALLPWALPLVAPEGVNHATWDAALD
jgi:hypothetical protein